MDELLCFRWNRNLVIAVNENLLLGLECYLISTINTITVKLSIEHITYCILKENRFLI